MSDPILLNSAADGAGTDLSAAWFAIHTGTLAGDETSTTRFSPTYGAAAGGVADITATLSFTGPASGSATHLGVWDSETVGTFRFAVALSGDQAFNAAGELDLTSAAITVT